MGYRGNLRGWLGKEAISWVGSCVRRDGYLGYYEGFKGHFGSE